MKYLVILTSICLFLLSACSSQHRISETERLLQSKHELRKFNIKSTVSTESRSCWFFVVGSYAAKTTETATIRFYFKTIDSSYVFKELPFNKVIIRIDSTVTTPYVKFYWNDCQCATGYAIYEESITRAVIYCRSEDFEPEININELQ
jgi:hypothetical protein